MRLPTLIMKLIKENWTSCPKVQAAIMLKKAGFRLSSWQVTGFSTGTGAGPAGVRTKSQHREDCVWQIGQGKCDRGAGEGRESQVPADSAHTRAFPPRKHPPGKERRGASEAMLASQLGVLLFATLTPNSGSSLALNAGA